MAETLPDRARRKRRSEGTNWTPADEADWLQRHPEDRPQGWVDPNLFTADDLIPDPGSNSFDDGGLQDFLDRWDIAEIYVRFCGKMTPNPNGKTEGIKISCPDPAHPDSDPSAWYNSDNQLWTCGGCSTGGDKYDIYALNRGWGFDYKPEFHKLKREMAIELGWTPPEVGLAPVLDTSNSDETKDSSNPTLSPENPTLPPEILAPVIPIGLVPDENFGLDEYRIDWESIIPPETFMWEWMQSTAMADDLPHEFYFWLGIQALGFASGTTVWMPDQRNIKPNFYVCNYGKTGSGKTRASQAFIELLKAGLPWDGDEYTESKGVQILYSPGSAEALLKSFSHEILDPVTNEFKYLAPVRGLLQVEEFASFIAKAARPGGNLKERLIELYDVFEGDVTHYSLSGGKIMARSPFCQMLTTTQPLAIHTFTSRTDVESGFLNRWVFGVGPRRRRRMAHGGASIDVTDAARMLNTTRDWCSTGKVMPLVGPSLIRWEKFFYDEVEAMVEYSEESMFSRVDLTLKKIIIALCINERIDVPTEEIIDKAAVLLSYLKRSLAMFSQDITYSESDDCIKRLVEIVNELASKGDPKKPITKRDITRRLSHKFSNETIRRAIQTATELGLVTPMQQKVTGKGRPTEGYVLS